jgi:CheY-like chemotaxis protein
MRILVIDDTRKHLDAAVKTLEEHVVTLCEDYEDAVELIKQGQWDAVLCDLLMPAGSRGDRKGVFLGQEVAVGWPLALLAAKQGVKHVAMITDACHHDHPASAMVDWLNDSCSEPEIFTVNNTKMLFTNWPNFIQVELDEEEETECFSCFDGTKIGDKSTKCEKCNGTKRAMYAKKGKNWGEVLSLLLKAK